MTTEQRAAVERLRKYHDNVFDPSAVYGASWGSNPQVQQDAARVVSLYLAEHPSDDDLPVTEEWLRSVGFEARGDAHPECGPIMVRKPVMMAANGRFVHVLFNYYADYCNCMSISNKETRGDVRRLCAAFDEPLAATR